MALLNSPGALDILLDEVAERRAVGAALRGGAGSRVQLELQPLLYLLAYLHLLDTPHILLHRLSFYDHLESIFDHVLGPRRTEGLRDQRPLLPVEQHVFDDNVVVVLGPLALHQTHVQMILPPLSTRMSGP